uniref:Uncharacterized protein n=1 Tax=Agrobacterium tumefaciens TaxID=358 RepID=A0A3Q8BA37_AGRTU|nr:hypothetical protein [Agrobacterium tomkonis]ARU12393.1 hypothetical protein AgrTiEU6_173 [Agrobacterium tumefaciens]
MAASEFQQLQISISRRRSGFKVDFHQSHFGYTSTLHLSKTSGCAD